MGYATQQDLVERFGEEELIQLTDREHAQLIVADVIDRALSDADAEIDSYLGVRYTLPLVSIPVLLVSVAANIARFRLMGDATTEEARKRYEDAIRLLRLISRGEVVLVGAQTVPPPPGGITVTQRSPVRQFGSDTLSRY